MSPSTTTRRSALAGVLTGGVAAAQARAAPDGRPADATAYVVPFSSVLPLTSAINGVRYQLYVRTPPDYAKATKRYPVIVTLDADYSFAIAANHLEHLAYRMAQAPDTILVSIAYAGVYPDQDRYHAERTRDYTPIFSPDSGYGPAFQARSGGGPAFLKVIETEVLPLIDRTYRTEPGERTLVGHSYGGLFGAWVFQKHPDVFNRYLLVSPSLWYAEEFILRNEAQAATVPPIRPTRVYMGVGSWEEGSDHKMASQMTRFAGQLAARRDPRLVVEHRVFEDETHASIFPAAFSTGVRRLFQPAA